MTAKTARGAPYENHYVFVFTIRGERIAEIHEHLGKHDQVGLIP